MANANLNAAARNKNDEFYTQYDDIEKEMNCYDPNIFRDKTILLPCDDPEWSNFTRYFAAKFKEFGIKKLISTSYAINKKKYIYQGMYSLFVNAEEIDKDKEITCGKIFTLERGAENVDIDNLQWKYLEGDGDFRSQEVKVLRDEADIIITNPPFSLFREFLSWILDGEKKFLIISNKNCLTYKEVFPLIMQNKIWAGCRDWAGGMWMESADPETVDKIIDGQNFKNVPAIWLTNLDHKKRHEPLKLMTEKRNIRHSKHKEIKGVGYRKYDNYDALEVPYTDAIPDDYDGVMGVPITFLDKYCPEQFEILGDSRYHDGSEVADDINYIDGVLGYRRILIKRRRGGDND